MPAHYRAGLIALGAGAMLPLAFAPFYFFPLALLSPAILFTLWHDRGARLSAWLGFAYGFGAFGVGVSWVYVTMHVFGKMVPALAALSTVLFVSYLALFYAVLGYLQARFRLANRFAHFVVVLPAAWVLLEWLRGWLLTGFPWLHLGYSQAMSPLGEIAPWFGVYAVSYLVILTVGFAVWAWIDRARRSAIIAASAILAIWIAPLLLGLVQWVQPAGKPIRVALVQANVSLSKKWQRSYRGEVINRYLEMSRSARDADLVIWPEAAVPSYLQYVDPAVLRELQTESKLYSTDFLFGVLELDETNPGAYFNSVARVTDEDARSVYRKSHLVPFGEYPPLDPLFRWLMQSMHIPMSDFSAGAPTQGPVKVAGHSAAISICYENLFGEQLLHDFPQAEMLVNVSENAWYGRSFAAPQLVQMAQMRSLETGRPTIRVDNAGPSVVIDADGRVRARTEQFTEVVMASTVQPMTGATPYVRWGNSVILGWLALLLFFGFRLYRRGHPAA